jgi:hypothetical protein
MEANPLSGFVMAILLREVPAEHHRWTGERHEVTLARYENLADAIASVAADEHEAAMLAVTAAAESAIRADVLACQRWGDGGPKAKAWGAFGVVTPKAEACGPLPVQAALALRLLRTSLAACAHRPTPYRMAWYLSGSCSRGAQESARRWRIASRHARE